jgi:hypothetical protein
MNNSKKIHLKYKESNKTKFYVFLICQIHHLQFNQSNNNIFVKYFHHTFSFHLCFLHIFITIFLKKIPASFL